MELTALTGFAAGRPRVLLAVAPGAAAVRVGVERSLRERGWPAVPSPAAADLLVVCGTPCEALAAAVERVWEQVPAPRARGTIRIRDDVDATLDEARARLLVPLPAGRDGGAGTVGIGGGQGEGTAHHHHGDGEGDDEVVAGLPLAGRAPDRDGLKLDRLDVPLGPVLSSWPAGLVLRLGLQGDVVQAVEANCLLRGSEGGLPFWSEPWLRGSGEGVKVGEAARRRAAAHLDSLGRLLEIAGAETHARLASRARDDLLAGDDAVGRAAALTLVKRTRRSRLLRWSLAGLGVLDRERAADAGVTGPALRAGGDVWDRVLQWLEEIAAAIEDLGSGRRLDAEDAQDGPRGSVAGAPPSKALVEVLPRLLVGTELAGARLIVASLDPDLDELVTAGAAVARG